MSEACPDCHGPKSHQAKRCQPCAAKHGYKPRQPTPPPTEECTLCGLPGYTTHIGLPHEEITKNLCQQHALEAHETYCHHVKNTALDNLTQQIKLMTG